MWAENSEIPNSEFWHFVWSPGSYLFCFSSKRHNHTLEDFKDSDLILINVSWGFKRLVICQSSQGQLESEAGPGPKSPYSQTDSWVEILGPIVKVWCLEAESWNGRLSSSGVWDADTCSELRNCAQLPRPASACVCWYRTSPIRTNGPVLSRWLTARGPYLSLLSGWPSSWVTENPQASPQSFCCLHQSWTTFPLSSLVFIKNHLLLEDSRERTGVLSPGFPKPASLTPVSLFLSSLNLCPLLHELLHGNNHAVIYFCPYRLDQYVLYMRK